MEKQPEKRQKRAMPVIIRSYFKPITPDFENETCQYCAYCDQDIDTFPCAKCHTRH